ncbi:MAG TPA: alpha-isopropylmalate synthase regulatory domain-containing protein [Paludibacteraceae bacterium]|nr:alpha-isopropylmalate synthase regulatory domain-containing protein [Paludibacteraceae bacterium]HPL94444.1 alpha-isopropylmalate synthase regulatory domain-containing protein [Paludibacteraceae bacterium]
MIKILDTTLRDGEQTSGVSFAIQEKLSIARLLLEDLQIDRIEVASARVSDGEFASVQQITKWAKSKNVLDKVEILGFVDGFTSLKWIEKAGGRVINLLCKGSLNHCTHQLRKTPQEHIADIKQVVANAQSMGITVNIYLEDWSNGIQQSSEYVFTLMDSLKDEPIVHFMLPDTLGILNPNQTRTYCSMMVERYPSLQFDFHAHNDYDMAVANVFEAVQVGIQGLHVTINGLGERAGNAPLASVVAMLHDQLHLSTNINEPELNRVSKLVEAYSGIRIPPNKPVVGDNVFTQCAGIHADGDAKKNLYFNDLLPERFGRIREYALGKTSGKANIRKNLEALGIELDEESMHKVTQRITELGDQKQVVTQDDLPYIVSDIVKEENIAENVRILNYSLSLAQGLKPIANILIEINGETYQEYATGDGQYDAFMKALWKIYDTLGKPHPILLDYLVTIPPGGRTDALVQTLITWDLDGNVFKTHGLDGDQTAAAIKATLKMLNRI